MIQSVQPKRQQFPLTGRIASDTENDCLVEQWKARQRKQLHEQLAYRMSMKRVIR